MGISDAEFAWSLQREDFLYRVTLVLEDTVCPGVISLWP